MIYLPIRNQFEQVKPPSYHSDFFEHLNFERSETETKNDEVEDGLRKYHLSILKVGNFTLTMLTAPSNSTLRSNFQSVRRSVKEILDHCEKLVLNQLSLVESAVQKKSASVSALVFNEVNQAVVYYPFAKFNVGLLPKTLAALLIEKFDVMMKEEARGAVVDLECSADGHFVQMTRWNQRTVIIYTDDKKVAYKEVVANVNSFRQSLSDIFL